MSLVDPRVTKQAEILVNYSLKFKKGERCVVIGDFAAKPLMQEIYRLLIQQGASDVRLHFSSYDLEEIYYKNASHTQITTFPELDMMEMQKMDCYIRIGSVANTRGLTGVDAAKMSERMKTVRKLTDYRVEHTRWVVTRFPTDAQAQEADMSLADYEDFVFGAINEVDWAKKFKEQEKLKDLVNRTGRVRIIGVGTDLSLDITGRVAVNAGGECNMPDGEVFTAPIENKTSGYITYSFPALYMGKEFHNVRLEFKEGKVVKAIADKGERDLNKILDTDSGSRTLGELGIGNNFQIQQFTKDILFDEKIGGTVHLALGKGYKENKSKNKSGLHWDMIKDLRKGGELWFDNDLVQQNGKWKLV